MSATIATRPTRSHATADPIDRGRALLARLFAGDFPFPSVPVCPPPAGDRRSAAECDALARAAGCRDLFVIHADVPAGERIIADLVRASADRVLILTPDPTAADRLAERLLTAGVPVIRAIADDENPTRPSTAVSKATSAALGVAQAEQTRRTAATALAAAEKRIGAFAVVSKAVARLVEVNEVLKALDTNLAERTARVARVEADVADEVSGRTATAFAELLAARKTAHDTQLAALDEQRTAARKAADEKEAEVAALRQHAAAANKSGFFSRLFSKPKPAEADEGKKSLPTAEGELAALTATADALQAEFAARSASATAEYEKLIGDERAARRSAAEAALQAAELERARAQAEAAALNKVISAAVPHDDYTAAAAELTAARERAAEAARAGPETLARATAEVRAVIGTPRCLDDDPIFAAFTTDPPFGLLVLDRAEDLPEAEFARLARQAERWVLIGDTAPRDEPRSINGRAPRGRTADVPFACRVAKLLDRETWAPEGDRLVCRLVHLSPDQRRNLVREPLADRPEIELRFTTDDEPALAEIAFPGSTAVPAAKSFLFHSLGEVLLRPCGEVVWTHAPDAITATWPAADAPRGDWIDLEPGVREQVTGAGLFAYTAAVSFDPAAGWDAERAAEWLGTHLPPPPIGRFAAVPRSR